MFKAKKVLAGLTVMTMSVVPASVIGDIYTNQRSGMVYVTSTEVTKPVATSTTSSYTTTTSTTSSLKTTTTTTTAITQTTTEATTTTTETTTETVVDEATTDTEAEVFVWEGNVLNTFNGIVASEESPSGYTETYYNMNMFGCLDLMNLPYDGYEERADGVKTYNGYVMVATPDLEAYPKGSYVPTTLGMGIVVDYCPGGNLDVAVNW